jgi:hypothetical protein
MPIFFTFDISAAPSNERNRIQSMFERLKWQHIGGSAYRYPRLGTTDEDQPVENWFNHVISALMLFRTYIVESGRTLSKYTLDVQTSAGLDPDTDFGNPPVSGSDIDFEDTPGNTSFGRSNLVAWLEEISYPYEVGEIDDE